MKSSAADIFHAALEMPPERREEFLLGACGRDLELRREVEALLKADARSGRFLASPTAAADVRADAAPAQEQPGAQIGRYKLLEQIGEGGMGTIWMAEQREPVKRRVALKIIKLGMDTKQVIARFEAERQALAMMDHPHIAKVLDAGATETGRPYFVMEYIKGIPILAYCDQEKLDTQARLELFTSVCHAIQHAHQKGIIHRDIKPSNVLVTLHDGVPVPKVIDFGIAKATNSELTTKTLFTEHRQMIGTPAYMSPEQAEMSGLDIDTRSDVYSLGVLLYELLTGTTPFDTRALLESGYNEMLRAIREDEPHKPSTRISSLGDTGTSTAQKRRVELKKLSTLLRGDIDWIVMKSLEKDRTRRYETANGLAADIRRHLAGDAVLAAPPSTSYRARKFVRRHRTQVIAAGLVTAVLVLGVVGTTLGMVGALDQKKRADQEAARATLAAEAESRAKVEAQANAQQATAAKDEEAKARKRAETVDDFVIAALNTGDPSNAGGRQDATILEAMDKAIADIDSGRFADDPETEAWLNFSIGQILANNGRLPQAEQLQARALERMQKLRQGDDEDLVAIMNGLATTRGQLGRSAEAEPMLVRALEMLRRLHPGDYPLVANYLNNLALERVLLGRMTEAKPLYEEAIALARRLPGGHPNMGNFLSNFAEALPPAEAEPLYAQALEIEQRRVHGDHPNVAKALDNLAKTRVALGRVTEAEPMQAEALAMRQRLFHHDHPDLVLGMNNQASLVLRLGRMEEGVRLLQSALEMRQRLSPGDDKGVAWSMSMLGHALHRAQRVAEAEPLFEQALAMNQRLQPADDDAVALCASDLAEARLALGRPAEAESLFREALAVRRRLYPGDRLVVADNIRNLATALTAQDRTSEAETLLGEARAMYGRLAGDDADIAVGIDNLGQALLGIGKVAEAEALIAQAVAMQRRLCVGDHVDLALGLNNLSQTQFKMGHFEEAEASLRESLAMEQRLGVDETIQLQGLTNLADLLRTRKRPADAEPYAAQALEMARRLCKSDDSKLTYAMSTLASLRQELGRFSEAEPLLLEGIEVLQRRLSADHPDVIAAKRSLGVDYWKLRQFDKSVPLLEEVLAAHERAHGRADARTQNAVANLGVNYRDAGRLAEAIALLEESYQASKRLSGMEWVAAALRDAYDLALAAGGTVDTVRFVAFVEEWIASQRTRVPEESRELAGLLAQSSLTLLGQRQWDAAEPLARECLAIREKKEPEAWSTFNAESMLGGVLLGQKRFAEAEPLLIDGYRGMKSREAAIPPQGRPRMSESIERIVQLYEATGNATEAAKWRPELEALRAQASTPPAEKDKR